MSKAKSCKRCKSYESCFEHFHSMDLGRAIRNLRDVRVCHDELLEVIAKYCTTYEEEESDKSEGGNRNKHWGQSNEAMDNTG